jgi:hypothetical protein
MWRRCSRTHSYTHTNTDANTDANTYANTYSVPITTTNIKYCRSTTAKLDIGTYKFLGPSPSSVWHTHRFSQRPMWKRNYLWRLWLRKLLFRMVFLR